MRKFVEKRLASAVEAQAKYYNRKHKLQRYNVGDYVYLNSKNIDSTRPTKKLDWKFYGPYRIVKPVGKQAYQLNLPKSMKIHNVFHVSLLKLCDKSKNGELPPAPPPINVDSEEEFEVEEILNSQTRRGKLQYLIKWLGYPDTDNEWVPEEQAAGSADLVELFHQLYPEKPCEGIGRKANATCDHPT